MTEKGVGSIKLYKNNVKTKFSLSLFSPSSQIHFHMLWIENPTCIMIPFIENYSVCMQIWEKFI